MAVSAKFIADFTSFNDAVQKADAKLSNFTQGTARVEKALQRMGDAFSGKKVVQDATLMAKAIDDLGGISKLSGAQLADAGRKASDALEIMKARGLEVPPALQKIADAAAEVERRSQFLDRAAANLQKFGTAAKTVGAGLTVGLTAPIVGIATAASKLAIDFESSFAGVKKTVNATDAEFAEMAQQFRNLAKEIPINVNEFNRLGEAAGALGIPKAEIVDFARVMAELGVTTNVTADQAAESIAKIQNIFGAAGKETERFASTLVALGNDGASTEAQILEMATRIAGAGNAVNMTQGQVLAFASALSSVGIEAEMGGSAISRVFIDIASAVKKGGEELDGFARVAGQSTAGFARAFKADAAGAVNDFVVGLGNIKRSGGDLLGTLEALGFSEIRVRDTLLRAAGAGDLLTRALDLQKKAWNENTALTEEARKRFETTEAQLTLLWNRIKDVGITVGNALLPVIKQLNDVIKDLIPVLEDAGKWFANLSPLGKDVVIVFAGILAAIGPVTFALGTMAGAIANILPLLKGLTVEATLAAGALRLLQGGVIVAAVIAIALAIKELWQAIKNLHQAWVEGKSMWDFFTAKDDDNFVRRALGWSKAIDKAAQSAANAKNVMHDTFGETVPLSSSPYRNAPPPPDVGGGKSLSGSLAAARKEIAALSASARAELATALRSGAFEMKELEKQTGLSERALKLFKDQIEKGDAAAKKSAEAVTKLHDEIKKLETVKVGEVTHFGLDPGDIDALRDRLDIQKKIAAIEPDMRAAGAGLNGINEALHGIGDGAGELDKVREHLKAVSEEGHLVVDIFQQIPSLIRDAVTGGGGLKGAFQGIASTIGAELFGENGPLGFFAGGALNKLGNKLTKVFGDSFGLALPGIGQAFGALLGPLIGKLFSIGGPSKEELEGRGLVEQFESQLAASLTLAEQREAAGDSWKKTLIAVRDALGDEARAMKLVERLWAASKEGPKAVELAILDIKEAMEAAKQAQTDLNEETKQSGPAISAAAQAAQAVLDDLMKQRESLAQAVANEAPEEVMGVIESQTRGQIAALDEAIARQQAEIQRQAEETARAVENEFNKIKPNPVTIEYDYHLNGLPPWARDFPSRELPEPIPMASGGDFMVRRPTLFLAGEAGPERATFSPLGKRGATAAQASVRQPVVIQLCDQELATLIIDTANNGGVVYEKTSRLVRRIITERKIA